MDIDNNNKVSRYTWKDMLSFYIENNKSSKDSMYNFTEEEKENEIFKDFMSYIEDNNITINNTTKSIPKFFYRNPLIYNELQLAVKSEAKHRFLINISNDIPDESKRKEIHYELKKNCSSPSDGLERINYRDFKKVASKLGTQIGNMYFRAQDFLRFDRDSYGRIDIDLYYEFIEKKIISLQNKLKLSSQDVFNLGFLTDKEVENYIKEEFCTFYFFKDMKEDLREYYLLVAQRKFFFFLDIKKTGKIYIKDLIASSILYEFLENKDRNINIDSSYNNNWFSYNNFLKIYRKYIELDKDRNGMLSKNELIRYGPGLTMIFIDRIFEEYQKYEGAIDFKQFIDFCLAMEYKGTKEAIKYFWKTFDVYHQNKIDTFIVNMFFRQIVKKLTNRHKPEYKVDDVKDEIWDMVKPKNQNYITLEDILASSHSEIILPLLFDAKAFLHHDQKELMCVEEFQDIENEFV